MISPVVAYLMLSNLVMGIISVVLLVFAVQQSQKYNAMRRKVYDNDRHCLECRKAEDDHHPNCPIGRLGL
jgi:hypothetical protein